MPRNICELAATEIRRKVYRHLESGRKLSDDPNLVQRLKADAVNDELTHQRFDPDYHLGHKRVPGSRNTNILAVFMAFIGKKD